MKKPLSKDGLLHLGLYLAALEPVSKNLQTAIRIST